MLEVLQRTSQNVFVPLTIGGGIREYTDSNGRLLHRARGGLTVFPLRGRQDIHRQRCGS